MSRREAAVGSAYWFVGACFGGSDDQTARFLSEGIWENGYQDRYLDLVKSIQPRDGIAIKSSFTRKRSLPFDNRGHTVSVMAIKAIGTVMENQGDGRRIFVKWREMAAPREWYFFTHRGTVWRVLPGDWTTDALIAFTFENKPQDIDRFRNAPYWKERFGDLEKQKPRFQWTLFYEAVADKLLNHKKDRSKLVAAIHKLAGQHDGLSNLQDKYSDVATGPLRDICPFTTMGIFNRGITDANRKAIAGELANFLGVKEPVPPSFEALPILNNQKSWFFGFEKDRQPDDIDKLWGVFDQAIRFAGSEDAEVRFDFMQSYDRATEVSGVGWNLTMGLFWARPWTYATLDSQSQRYMRQKLNIQIPLNGPKGRCNAEDYLKILDTLEARFPEEAYPVHSFPELSLAAWVYRDPGTPLPPEPDGESEVPPPPLPVYSVDNILADGCFLERVELERLRERLRTKKNLILQGPPGTGKTWLARRLAFALVGERNDRKVKVVQFHPNLSYEDFVRGWRPTGEGRLELVDGSFMEMVQAASKEPNSRYAIVIEEINRGNPAQIFGEMLTLLEVDKRTPEEAMELCYRRGDGERVCIPDNLYVIGTMNIADRSLALVDLALRRRFAFAELVPMIGKKWRDWVHTKCGIDKKTLLEIEKRILALNEQIKSDANLGPQFRIGHSYVTPPFKVPISDAREWFRQVVETEIGPLLDEYWFDSLETARNARRSLTEGL